ncbi:UNVERIFIED_CONTAM: hypothetical protein NCL1_16734 [Trichonephila clavipes]
MQRLPGTIFQQDNARLLMARVSQDRLCPVPRLVSNRAYLGSFGTASWAFHEFERTSGKVTANMERNVSKHHSELVKPQCLIVSHFAFALQGAQQGIKTYIILLFSLK